MINILRLVLQKDNKNYSKINIKKLEEEYKRTTRSEKRTTMLIQQHKSNSNNNHRNSRQNSSEEVINLPSEDLAHKTFNTDLDFLMRVLLQHSVDKPPEKIKVFEPNHVNKILDFMKNGYFSHYSLFKYVLNSQNKKEEIKIVVCVNTPLEVAPLSEALYMGKNQFVITDEDDEYVIIILFNSFWGRRKGKKRKKNRKNVLLEKL